MKQDALGADAWGPEPVSVEARVRPLRIAFAVEAEKLDSVLLAAEINTCLWGGACNPLFPVCGQVPSHWGRRFRGSPAALLESFERCWEPDYIVNLTHVPLPRTQVPIDVIEMSTFLDRSGRFSHGLDMESLYAHLWKDTFRFQLRRSSRIGIPQSADSEPEAFVAVTFGHLPAAGPRSHFRASFRRALGARPVRVTPEAFFTPALHAHRWPIWATIEETRLVPRCPPVPPHLLLIDHTSPADLLDFWNLRALGWNVAAVPVAWADGRVHQVVAWCRGGDSAAPKGDAALTIVKGRSVGARAGRRLATRIQGRLGVEAPYVARIPTYWDIEAQEPLCAVPPQLVHESIEERPTPRQNAVTLREAKPAFVEVVPSTGYPLWATAINLSSYPKGGLRPQVLPVHVRNAGFVFRATTIAGGRLTSEGFVHLDELGSMPIRLELPSGLQLVGSALEPLGLSPTISAAGKTAWQMALALGGPHGAWVLQCPELLGLLNEAVGTNVARKRDWVPVSQALGRLSKHRARGPRKERVLQVLTESGALALGCVLVCSRCGEENWARFPVASESLTCEYCLRDFRFSLDRPPRTSQWAYRPRGPFSQPGMAGGAYAVLLALGFLADASGAITWAPSVHLGEDGGRALEADFAALWKRQPVDRHADILFGECKSFHDEFSKRELRRAATLARMVPGSVQVFATMRKILTSREQAGIRRVANFARRYRTPDGRPGDAFPLTDTELFGSDAALRTWTEIRKGGAKHDDLTLRALAAHLRRRHGVE